MLVFLNLFNKKTKMRKIIFLILSIYIFTGWAQAHQWRIDSNGGHSCYTDCASHWLETWEYHYHRLVDGVYDYSLKSSTSYKINTQKRDKHLINAKKYLEDQEYDKSILEYEKVFNIEWFDWTDETLLLRDQVWNIYLVKGYELYQSEELKSALVEYEKSLDYLGNQQSRFDTYKTIAYIYFELWDNNTSIDYYYKAKNYALYSNNDTIGSDESIAELNNIIKVMRAKIVSTWILVEQNNEREKYKKAFKKSLWKRLEKLSTKTLVLINKKIDKVLLKEITDTKKSKLEGLKELIEDIIDSKVEK